MSSASASDKFLTTPEAARYCGVNFRTVLRWIDKGLLNAYRLPGKGDFRIEMGEFVHFLQDHQLKIPNSLKAYLESDASESTPESSVGKPRVLIVDDEANVARAIQRQVRSLGFETEMALDAFHAGALLHSFKPTIMTLDLRMPGVSGFGVIQTVKASLKHEHVKILVISAEPAERLEKALYEGADDFLAKPFHGADLAAKLKKLSN